MYRSKVGDEEELDFYLEPPDDNMSDRNPTSKV
jgi:hypothetical protein